MEAALQFRQPPTQIPIVYQIVLSLHKLWNQVSKEESLPTSTHGFHKLKLRSTGATASSFLLHLLLLGKEENTSFDGYIAISNRKQYNIALSSFPAFSFVWSSFLLLITTQYERIQCNCGCAAGMLARHVSLCAGAPFVSFGIINQFFHLNQLATPTEPLYSASVFDLSQDEVKVTIPEIDQDRHWSFAFYDPWVSLPPSNSTNID